MKKIFALLMACVMLLGVSGFAEEDVSEQECYYQFELDYCPEGYEKMVVFDDPMTICFYGAEDAAVYYFSVAYAEEAANETMPVEAELSVEAYQTMQNQFSVDYSHPEFFYFDQTDKNGEGVGVMAIHETDLESGDMGEVISLWHGYLADISIVKNSALTEEDYRIALQMIQELKVTEQQ